MPLQLVCDGLDKYLTPEYENTGDLCPDMGTLIDEAISKAEDDETRNEYKRMKQFYHAVQQIVEREMTGYDEYGYPRDLKGLDNDSAEALTESEKAQLDEMNVHRANDSKVFSRAEDFTPDELEQMSTEDLEEMSRVTEDENEAKREKLEEIKKKELIAKIKNAVEEGKALDAKIATVRDFTKEK